MRVVLNTRTNKYEIHRTSFFMNQRWENDSTRGGYWWQFSFNYVSQFYTPEAAMCAYNHSRGRPKPLKHYITVKRFW